MHVCILLHKTADAEETLPGSVSVLFPQEAEQLREYFKANIRYGGMKVFKFHWEAGSWLNISPELPSCPLDPLLLSPPVPFIESVAAACDATELVADYRIHVELNSGQANPGREVALADINDLNWPAESEARAR